MKNYPLMENMKDRLFTYSGKTIDDITIENIKTGDINTDDCRISKETLLAQAQIAEKDGNVHLASNFRRASEMVAIPSERIIEIYNALRPYRSSIEDLNNIINELESEYKATTLSLFIKDARDTLEKRGKLKGDR